MKDTDSDHLQPQHHMLWSEYKRLPESTFDFAVLITESGTCLYDSKVYINKYSAYKLGQFKKMIGEDKDLADQVQRYRFWLIEDTRTRVCVCVFSRIPPGQS